MGWHQVNFESILSQFWVNMCQSKAQYMMWFETPGSWKQSFRMTVAWPRGIIRFPPQEISTPSCSTDAQKNALWFNDAVMLYIPVIFYDVPPDIPWFPSPMKRLPVLQAYPRSIARSICRHRSRQQPGCVHHGRSRRTHFSIEGCHRPCLPHQNQNLPV